MPRTSESHRGATCHILKRIFSSSHSILAVRRFLTARARHGVSIQVYSEIGNCINSERLKSQGQIFTETSAAHSRLIEFFENLIEGKIGAQFVNG